MDGFYFAKLVKIQNGSRRVAEKPEVEEKKVKEQPKDIKKNKIKNR